MSRFNSLQNNDNIFLKSSTNKKKQNRFSQLNNYSNENIFKQKSSNANKSEKHDRYSKIFKKQSNTECKNGKNNDYRNNEINIELNFPQLDSMEKNKEKVKLNIGNSSICKKINYKKIINKDSSDDFSDKSKKNINANLVVLPLNSQQIKKIRYELDTINRNIENNRYSYNRNYWLNYQKLEREQRILDGEYLYEYSEEDEYLYDSDDDSSDEDLYNNYENYDYDNFNKTLKYES